MKKSEITKYSLINSLATALYVTAVASFMFLGKGVFGEGNSIFAPIFMLMLFVFSAALTGILIFGRPIMWYLDKKKREAILLLFYTLGFFLVIMIIVFLFLILLI